MFKIIEEANIVLMLTFEKKKRSMLNFIVAYLNEYNVCFKYFMVKRMLFSHLRNKLNFWCVYGL